MLAGACTPPSLLAPYLVLLAGGSRWFNQLLQDPQAHEGNVLNNHGSLNVHGHEEKAECWAEEGKAELHVITEHITPAVARLPKYSFPCPLPPCA